MWASTKAIVVTGQYAPKGFATEYMNNIPAGRGGSERRRRVHSAWCATRSSIGADWIKIYADYRWGPNGEAMPGPTLEEFNVGGERREELRGDNVAAHATTAEGMRRADSRRSRRSSTATTARRKCSAHGGAPASATSRRFPLEAEQAAGAQVRRDAGVTICNGADSGPVASRRQRARSRRARDESASRRCKRSAPQPSTTRRCSGWATAWAP
jgi:hypothetical protein